VRRWPFALAVLSVACVTNTPKDRVIDYLALCSAARAGNELLVEALLERGAPVDALDVNAAGMLSAQAVETDSPLQAAARRGDVTVVRMLLAHRPWVDHRCCDSPAALGLASEAGHIAVVSLLLESGADPELVSSYESGFSGTSLDAARRNGHAEVAALIERAIANRGKQES
jgi:ankyrin repeat protein